MPGDAEVPHLVRGAADGQQAAWDALVDRFAPLVWAVARGHGLGVTAAAEVAQTTWLRLVESLGTAPAEALGCWLAAATRAEALHALRWADPRVEVRRPRPGTSELREALESLPARSRLALRLVCVPGVTQPEVASGLGITVEEAKQLLAASLERLAVALDLATSSRTADQVPQ